MKILVRTDRAVLLTLFDVRFDLCVGYHFLWRWSGHCGSELELTSFIKAADDKVSTIASIFCSSAKIAGAIFLRAAVLLESSVACRYLHY